MIFSISFSLKAQRQIRDILQGASSLGVKFTKKVVTSSFRVRIRILLREVGNLLLVLNELGEKSVNLTILGTFVNKP